MTNTAPKFLKRPAVSRQTDAFTLVEITVSMGVLLVLVVMIALLFNSATTITTQGNKHMDADAQVRTIFERMAIDFGQMLKRSDVDYFFKDPNNPQTGAGVGANDQLAFYSEVPGYYPAGGAQSPVSLVAYRVNGNSNSAYYNQLQRLGYGLVWSGVTVSGTTATPMIYSAASTTALPNTISLNWPSAVNRASYSANYEDSNYEAAGPQVFRMEYYYVIRSQTLSNGTVLSSTMSATPWDTRIQGIPGIPDHTSVNGLQDVAGISVVIAVIDPKSLVLVTQAQLAGLSEQMQDFATGMNPGDLEAQWSAAINSSANGLPRIAASAIRVYRHDFYLASSPVQSP